MRVRLHGQAITGGKAYVTTPVNAPHGLVKVISIATNQVSDSIAVGRDGWGIASLSGNVFVANQSSGNASVIETSNNQVVSTITTGSLPTGIAGDPSTARVYVTNQGDNTITVIGVGPIP